MKSRQRITTALNHQEPDRVPIDFGGLTTSLHHEAHDRLLKHLGLPMRETSIMDMFQQIVEPAPELRQMFHADAVNLFANPGTPWKRVDEDKDIYQDEWGVLYTKPPDGYWYDLSGHPLREGTLEEMKSYRPPDPRDPKRIEGLARRAKELLNNTDKAIVLYSPTAGVFEHSYWLRGIDSLFFDMAFNLDYVEALAEKVVEWQLSFWNFVLEEVGEYIQVVELGDDLGGQYGPLFSPDIYRRVYKPRHRRLTDLIHRKSNARIFFHTCGSVDWAIPDIIESGMDIINPVQVSARGMDTEKLKREYGEDIVFWGGGADATQVMTFSSPKGVKEEVKKRVHDLAPGGGFVFASIHNIQANVPPENIVALFEAAYEYGSY
jgi:uroporphyrinogen decarboxylase